MEMQHVRALARRGAVLGMVFVALFAAGSAIAQVPVGTVLAFYGNTNQRPEGYLFCDGSRIVREQYPELYNHLIGANPDLRIDEERAFLPDLRKEFLRGLDESRFLGSHQESQAELAAHQHRTVNLQHGVEGGAWGPSRLGAVYWDRGRGPAMDGEVAQLPRETRPQNVALNFLMKAVP